MEFNKSDTEKVLAPNLGFLRAQCLEFASVLSQVVDALDKNPNTPVNPTTLLLLLGSKAHDLAMSAHIVYGLQSLFILNKDPAIQSKLDELLDTLKKESN